ncbi:glycosyltransferase [Thalassotalea castellviae]|uniref:Glycosyltransferase n=1 Tax=Thalassotalea castellviae TaxID=3075612 RepID=A0ABU2ZZR7_9GAMM|nr:glycosyltransferase [Thalassotalea sp. W431]MDT0602807.1 glycosyltransferase [Thalassotalea sp. W431]
MKVAIFVDQFPVRSQTFVLNQIIGLIDLGCDITIISLHKGDGTLLADIAQYNLDEKTHYLLDEPKTKYKQFFYRIGCLCKCIITPSRFPVIFASLDKNYGRQGKSLLLAAIAAKLPNVLNFDVAVCHFGYNGILANKLKRLGLIQSKIATIFHGHEISDTKSLSRYSNDYHKLFKETELLLPISELWKDKLVKLGCPLNKIYVQRMGINLEKFSYKGNIDRKRLTHETHESCSPALLKIYTVARFTDKKGLKYAIQSLTHLPKGIKVHYDLAGYGELETELKLLVRQLGLADVVHFVGACSSTQVADFMRKADVYLQPSITASDGDMEGVPVTLMEAMAIGVPVVSTFHSGIPELIENEVHGLLVPEKDPQAIAEKLTLIYNNKENVVEQLVRNARDRVEFMADNHTLNQNLRDILYQLSC